MQHNLFHSKFKPSVGRSPILDIIRDSPLGENPHRAVAMELIFERTVHDCRERMSVQAKKSSQADPVVQPNDCQKKPTLAVATHTTVTQPITSPPTAIRLTITQPTEARPTATQPRFPTTGPTPAALQPTRVPPRTDPNPYPRARNQPPQLPPTNIIPPPKTPYNHVHPRQPATLWAKPRLGHSKRRRFSLYLNIMTLTASRAGSVPVSTGGEHE